MKYSKMIVMVIMILVSCGRNEKKAEKTIVPEKKSYMPVYDLLMSEVRNIDSVPVGILKKIIVKGKTDSAFIDTSTFNRLVKEFITPELKKDSLEKYFSETSFFDQSMNIFTFTYQSKTNATDINRVDVLGTQGFSSDKIKSIYIDKEFSRNDTLIHQKIYWKSGQGFNVISEKKVKNGPPYVEQLKVIWDPSVY